MSPSTSPLFALEDVRLIKGERTILDGVDVEITDVGITMLVGRSGSGKSTLLRLLNGLERPTSGAVRYRGTPVDDLDIRAHRRQVGMVFQRPTVFDGTGLDNLLVADPAMTSDAAIAALTRVGLGRSVLDQSARELSGGEAQRLCLARTLATHPTVVLMDEPTSSLDAENVATIESLAREIVADDGSGGPVRMIWVTHDRNQVERLADRVVRIEAGRVLG